MGNLVDYALQFDGSQNYVSLGTMGNFGSNLGSGFYCSFQIKTTSTSDRFIFGSVSGANSFGVTLELNQGGVAGKVTIVLTDNTGKILRGIITTPFNFYDGTVHTFVITIIPSTNTITLTIDGNSEAITYSNQQTPSSFINFPSNRPFIIGAYQNFGSVSGFYACTLDNFQIGTSSSVLYGSYPGITQLGSGTTLKDVSGQGNNGTLTGSPLPLWVKNGDYNIAINSNVQQPTITSEIETF